MRLSKNKLKKIIESYLREAETESGQTVNAEKGGKTKTFTWISTPPAEAAATAKKEADMWESGKSPDGKKQYKRGYMKESDREAHPVLKKYFESVKPGQYFHQHPKDGKEGTSWSAAFVTYCMQQADSEAKWDRSINHRAPKQNGYLHLAWNRRAEIEKNPEKYVGKTVYIAFSGKEIIGNQKSNKHSTIKPEDQLSGEKDVLTPGDVVGVRQSSGRIHMDIYTGGGQIVGGNVTTPKGKQTCGYRSISPETSDVIKRVEITGVVNTNT
jgi:hypothetical protein